MQKQTGRYNLAWGVRKGKEILFKLKHRKELVK